jgi:sulfoxide reductase heme-binding subunit YedZ
MARVSSALWYLGRGSGVSALVLFTIVVVLGILARAGRPFAGLPRFGVTALHRTMSLMAVFFLAVHVTTLTLDPYAQLRLVDAVLPFRGAYRPVWQGLGTVAVDLVAALGLSSLLRNVIGARAWRAIHWLAYLFWPLAVMHAVGNGTDGRSPWLLVVVGACVGAVGVSGAWRLTSARFAARAPTRTVRPSADLAGLR